MLTVAGVPVRVTWNRRKGKGVSATQLDKKSGCLSAVARMACVGGALGLSAYLMTVALASPRLWWLGWCTLLPLLLSIRAFPPLRALAAGGFWGACLYAFSAIGGGASFTATFPSFALLCGVPGLYALVGSVITRRVGFSPLLLGLLWVGVELALHPLGLRNGLLAATQDGVVVTVLGNVVGYALVAFLVVYVNATVLSVLSDVCVCVSVPATRFVRGSGSTPRRLFPLELPIAFLRFLRLWQPRGPPA